VETLAGGVWRRTISTPAGAGVVEVRAGERRDTLRVRIAPPLPGAVAEVVTRVTRVFDLHADARGIAAELRHDPALRAIVPAAGVRVPGAWDAFEMGVRAIVGQQVSVAGARTLLGRLVERCGSPLPLSDPSLARLFPSPEAIASADLDRLGLTGARSHALRRFAGAVARGELDLEALSGLETAIERLSSLPGIGAWTAHEIALRGLGEPDAFPAGDLGVRRALARGRTLPPERAVRRRAERWRPWRGYAATALWNSDPGTRRSVRKEKEARS
jgi:AraC family transcriptional regulator of adaptative response / DNA-3-methyladenine glycosylase II